MAEIHIDYLSKKFEKHLNIDGNKRSIVSGKFGTGKTYFLKKFFKENSHLYNAIILNPVNYVVSTNEDIFELIKADIVNDLFFTGKIEFSKSQKTKLFEKLFLFCGEKPEAVFKFVSSLLSKFNPLFEFTDDYLNSVKELKKSFTDYSKELTAKEKNRHEELADFMESFEEKKGSINEHNYITKVINTFLIELKGNKSKKKNILVIDDLDRIDPEHIFRILNILSAHNNNFNEENKFEFDHIIVVCDVENIEKIFIHKYGAGVDFEGYIDKFFSTDIFFINNGDAILLYVNSLNETVNFSNAENKIIIFLLNYFVKKQIVTVRKLMKMNFPVKFEPFIIDEFKELRSDYYNIREFAFIENGTTLYTDSDDLGILKIYLLFSRIFGSLQSFTKALEESGSDANWGEISFRKNEEMIHYLILQNHISSVEGENLYISKEIYNDTFRETKIINGISWPTTSLFDNKFVINVNWQNGKPYKGQISYFSEASIKLMGNRNFDYDDWVIKSSTIARALNQILKNCHNKNLFYSLAI